MEDSQLSDQIRLAVNGSQGDDKNCTQELSQRTIDNIINGNFTPIMSQGTEDFLTKEIDKNPITRAFYHGNAKISPLKDGSDMSTPSIFFEKARQTGLKRRTPRISDIKINEPIKGVADLNSSEDLFGEVEISSLLNESFVSTMTLSQKQLDSQDIPYLRPRTAEEQETRNRAKELAMIEAAKKEEEKSEQEAMDRMAQSITQNMTQQVTPMENDYDDAEPSEPTTPIVKQPKQEVLSDKDQMNIHVIESKIPRVSDASYQVDGSKKKHLWTKRKCKVPMKITWNVNSVHGNKKLRLRLRLVHCAGAPEIPIAIRQAGTDVQKCSYHIGEEELIPREAFFYIFDSTLKWRSNAVTDSGSSKGVYYVAQLDPGMSEVEFNIKFMCQKNCLPIEDKRKTMCFVAFIDDENGNEILHDIIDEVRIVGYPRRDRENFCKKEGIEVDPFHFPETSSYKPSRSSLGIVKKEPLRFGFDDKMFKAFENSLNIPHPTQMNSSIMNPRKRVASDHILPTNSTQMPSTSEYSRRLHGCVPMSNLMDYENQESSSTKKSRPSHFPYEMLPVSKVEYQKVVQFLYDDAMKAQRATSVRYPSLPPSILRPEDDVNRFLALVGLSHNTTHFANHNILSMADLMREFEHDYNVFEKIGIDSSKLEKCYEVFLNFYRIQKGNQLFAH